MTRIPVNSFCIFLVSPYGALALETDFLWEVAGEVVAKLLLPSTPLPRGVLTTPTPLLTTALSHILLAGSLAGCHLAGSLALSLVWLA